MEDIINLNILYDKNENKINELIIGNSYSSFNNNSLIDMTVVNQNDKVVRQSKEYFILNTNKLKTCLFSGILNNLIDSTGFTSRIGCFDNINGLFFELTDNILYVVLRYATTDIRIPQSNFLYDKLDGYGISKYRLTRYNQLLLFKIEFQLNNIGKIKYFIYINNKPLLVHEFDNHQNTDYYLKINYLPIRYEIIKNINNIIEAKMSQSTSSIQIEGKYKLHNVIRYETILNNNLIKIYSKTPIPLFSIRLKNEYIKSVIKNFIAHIHTNTDDSILMIGIIKNPIFNDIQPVWIPKTNSMIEYDITANSIDLNNLEYITIDYISKDYIPNQKNKKYNNKNNILTSSINNVSDILTVVISSLRVHSIIFPTFEWTEFY